MVASAIKDATEMITGRTCFRPAARGALSRDREFQLKSQYEKRSAWKSARKSLSENGSSVCKGPVAGGSVAHSVKNCKAGASEPDW